MYISLLLCKPSFLLTKAEPCFQDMFDICYSNGANLNIVNKQNFSPLTLAAKLKRVDVSGLNIAFICSRCSPKTLHSMTLSFRSSESRYGSRCSSIYLPFNDKSIGSSAMLVSWKCHWLASTVSTWRTELVMMIQSYQLLFLGLVFI